ncbi:pyridoxal phosphate-dependent aminotransferase [Fructobacillus durionis]|uniref:Aminotransferase n=1 Tax=Fructobacillus durionis TaxID=283737 RepID=A0A1I1EDP1_9LACO|nr:pyridoxal phosphate-dependent aminotransferase [Fructobacillus durionis]SFB83080.1 Aspartate/methionine/tyrosine aminotransferase [Fructobacillus durionis]
MLEESEFSTLAQSVHPSATLAVSKKAKAMTAAGEDVINLGIGEPDFKTPEPIAQAAIAAIETGKTSFYTPVSGTLSLRQGIVDLAKKLTGQELSVNQVVVTTGAKMALYAMVQALVNPGDFVVSAKPYWVSYAEQVNMAGADFIAVGDEKQGKLRVADLDALDRKPKLIMVNNPTNPSGILYSKEEILGLLNWAEEQDVFIMIDEIYGRLVYNGATFTSAMKLKTLSGSKVIVVDGVSKSYSMTGWRIGWALADESVIANMSKLLGHMTSGPTAAAQAAAEAAVTESQEVVEGMRKTFEERLNATYALIEKIDGLNLAAKPEGAFYFFIKVDQDVLDRMNLSSTLEFADKLLEAEKVALPAGEGFGMPGYLRLSYAQDQATLNEALKRIERFIK